MSTLVVSVPNSRLRAILSDVPDGVEVVEWDLQTAPPRDSIDMVVLPSPAPVAFLAATGRVQTRLVQSMSIGYDSFVGNVPSGTIMANAATVHETATAELTMALLLAVSRGIPAMVRNQDRHHWNSFATRGLADATVLLVGYGGVGKAIAQRLDPFEVNLVRVATAPRDDARGHIHGRDELPELLPTADVVIVIVPLTPETTGRVDDAFLSALPDGAVVINVARGKVADTDALARHAYRLQIVLDVTDPEPLPEGHPLWDSAALISPHMGGMSAALPPRMHQLLQRQIQHLLNNEEPENVVLRG